MHTQNEITNISVPATEAQREALYRNVALWAKATGQRRGKLATFLRTIGMEWTPPTESINTTDIEQRHMEAA